MNTLVNRFIAVEKSISKSHGDFTVFALLSFDDGGSFTIVAAAKWMDSDISKSGETIEKILGDSKTLTNADFDEIKSLRVLSTDDRGIQSLTKRFSAKHEAQEIYNENFEDRIIYHGYLITVEHQPEPALLRR